MICACGKKFYLHPKDTIGPPEKGASLVHSYSTIEVHSFGLRRFYQGEAVKNAQISVPATETIDSPSNTLNSPNRALKPPKSEHKKKLSKIFLVAPLKNGKLELDRKSLAEQLSNLEDCTANILIEREKKNRSIPQNKWYWSCIIPMIAKEIGEYDEEEIHEILKTMFLKKVVVVKGKELWKVGSTTKLDVGEFGEYCEKVRTWAAQFLNVSIPDPDKNWLFANEPELIDEK